MVSDWTHPPPPYPLFPSGSTGELSWYLFSLCDRGRLFANIPSRRANSIDSKKRDHVTSACSISKPEITTATNLDRRINDRKEARFLKLPFVQTAPFSWANHGHWAESTSYPSSLLVFLLSLLQVASCLHCAAVSAKATSTDGLCQRYSLKGFYYLYSTVVWGILNSLSLARKKALFDKKKKSGGKENTVCSEKICVEKSTFEEKRLVYDYCWNISFTVKLLSCRHNFKLCTSKLSHK